MNTAKQNKGFAMLIVVLIILAAGLSLSIGLAVNGLSSMDQGFDQAKGSQAATLSDGCLAGAWQAWRLNRDYQGESLSQGEGSCIITAVTSTVVSGAMEFTAKAYWRDYSRAVWSRVILDQGGKIKVLEYDELENY